jgi:hypothetical protein
VQFGGKTCLLCTAEFILQEFYIGLFLTTKVRWWRLRNNIFSFQNTVYNLSLTISSYEVIKSMLFVQRAADLCPKTLNTLLCGPPFCQYLEIISAARIIKTVKEEHEE